MHDLTWKPKPHHILKANVTRFMKRHEIASVEEFIQRATTGVEWFWDTAAHETQMEWFEPYTQILDASEGFLKTRWFIGGKTNITLNCLDRHVLSAKKAQGTALVFFGNTTDRSNMTYAELATLVLKVAHTLLERGVSRGDRVVLHLPTSLFAVASLLAVFKIGAIAVPMTVETPAETVQQRAKQLDAKLVLDHSVRVLATVSDKEPLATVELPSEYPALILYSRGTMGEPKPIVHTHAGLLAQVSKEFWFHWDFQEKDVTAWPEPFGSLMSLWQILGTLHFGSTAVLFESHDLTKTADHFLIACDHSGVTHLGLPQKGWTTLKRAVKKTPRIDQLKKLRILSSSGGCWDEDTYRWCFEVLGRSQIPVMTLTGTTEFFGSSLAPLIVRAIKPLSSQGPGLGMAVAAFAQQGYALPAGQSGTLVCCKPAPSLCKGFWKDQARFVQTYLADFSNVWSQRDWVLCDENGQWFLKGRVEETVVVAQQKVLLSDLNDKIRQNSFVQKSTVELSSTNTNELLCRVTLHPGIGKTQFVQRLLKETILKNFGRQKPGCEIVIQR